MTAPEDPEGQRPMTSDFTIEDCLFKAFKDLGELSDMTLISNVSPRKSMQKHDLFYLFKYPDMDFMIRKSESPEIS